MTTIVDFLTQLVGELPSDPSSPDMVLWVLGVMVLIFLVCELFALLHTIFKSFIGG